MPLPDDGEPDYARRPGESPKAFAAFQAFRDLPASTRSVAKAAEALGKSVNTLHRWSRAHDWVLRAAAWDGEQDLAVVWQRHFGLRSSRFVVHC
jgi:hypothetical protein